MPGCFVSSDLRGWVGGGWGPGMQEWVLETISHQTYWPMWHLSKNCLQSHCYNLFLMCIHISHTVLILQVLWFGPLTHLVLQVLGFSGLGKDSWRCPSPSGLVLIVRILHPGIMCSTWQQHFSLCTFCPALRFPHWLFGSLSAYKPQPSWKGGEKPYGFLGWLWIQHEGAVSPLSRTMDVVCVDIQTFVPTAVEVREVFVQTHLFFGPLFSCVSMMLLDENVSTDQDTRL